MAECLESVFNQTYQNFEIFVVDDHSEDDGATEMVVRTFNDPRLHYIYLDENRGPGAARNVGLAQATGKYVSFIDSDDLWRPGKLSDHINFLESDPSIGMVYSDYYEMDQNGTLSEEPVWRQRHVALPSGNIGTDFISNSFIATFTITVRKQILDSLGGFDESLFWNEDDDLWFRIIKNNKVICSDYISGICRRHDENMSHDRDQMVLHQYVTYEKFISNHPEFFLKHRRVIRRRINVVLFNYLKNRIRSVKWPSKQVLHKYVRLHTQLSQLKIRPTKIVAP